jgi:CheY-like chemotaxis protein
MNDASFAPRVLLVEDETLVAGMLHGMLSTLGYTVADTTSSVDEAMQILDREVIDVVVLDINLDGEMSYPIADALTARGVPFIFSTGYGKDSLPQGYEGVSLLKKPFRRSALGEALADLLPAKSPSRAAVGVR